MSRQFLAVRGIAILIVILNHSINLTYWMAGQKDYALPEGALSVVLTILASIGVLAVPVFLFLSGSFFGYSIANRDLKPAYKSVAHNIVTVLVPYLIWSIAFYMMVFFFLGERYTPLQYVKNLLVGYPLNFIPLLIFFYLLAPFLVIIGKRRPGILIGLTLLYQILLANQLNPGLLGFAFPSWIPDFSLPVIRGSLSTWAVYFPLGVVYSLNKARITQVLKSGRGFTAATCAVLFVALVLNDLQVIAFPLAFYLTPLAGVCLIPGIAREEIPFYRLLETYGKHAYALYLTNLEMLYLFLFTVNALLPVLFQYFPVLIALAFFIALIVPLQLIRLTEQAQGPKVSRYVFGS